MSTGISIGFQLDFELTFQVEFELKFQVEFELEFQIDFQLEFQVMGFDTFQIKSCQIEIQNQLKEVKELDYEMVGFINQKEIVEYYAKSDTVVVPSIDGETWGLVVNEALQCGCRVIATDKVGSSRDLLQAYPHEVIASNDASALREAINRGFLKQRYWVDDPNRYKQIPKPSDLSDTVIQWLRKSTAK